MALAKGSFATTGYAADFRKQYNLQLATGNFATSGHDAELLTQYSLQLDAGSFTTTGYGTDLLTNYNLQLATGNFTEAGYEMGFKLQYSLELDTGHFNEAGFGISFILQESVLQEALRKLHEYWRFMGNDVGHPATRGPQYHTGGAGITLDVVGQDDVTVTRAEESLIDKPGGDAETLMLMMINDIWRRVGLDHENPLTISAVLEMAGDVAIDLSENAGVVTLQRQNTFVVDELGNTLVDEFGNFVVG